MKRIEVNVSTGECKTVELTPEEIADIQAGAPSPAEAVKAEIQNAEFNNPITHRALREMILAVGDAFPEAKVSQFYMKAKAVDDEIVQLRAQLQ